MGYVVSAVVYCSSRRVRGLVWLCSSRREGVSKSCDLPQVGKHTSTKGDITLPLWPILSTALIIGHLA